MKTEHVSFTPFRLFFTIQLAIPLLLVGSALGQNPAPPPTGPTVAVAPAAGAPATEVTAERVIVTGSNIPTAEEVGPNPVLNYDRQVIEKSGERTTEEFLRDLPAANATGIPVSNNENGSNTAVGAATIALRAFDSRATLILIDGRRVAPYPIGNNPGPFNSMFVDLNSIPQAAIESIEILKDGASTTYGADAVAGVVNIKLRHNYQNGAEASVEYGNTLDKDSGEFATSAIFGVGNDTTNITGVINYYHRNSIFNHDRGFSQVPPFLSSNASPYNLELSSNIAALAGGPNLSPGGTEFASAPNFTNGLAPASSYFYNANARVRSGSGQLPGFNFNKFSESFPEAERYGVYLSGEHKFIGDQLVVYADGFYQNVKAHNELAGPATGNFQTFGQTILAIPPHSPIAPGAEPPKTPTHAETGVPADAFNPFNPFNQIISGGTRARLQEFGNRLFDDETDAWLSTVGVKGDKLFDGSWGYDAAFRYSQSKREQTGQNISASLFNRILNGADPIFDPTSSQFIGTTVPFNPFTDYRRPFPSNEATIEFARVHPHDVDTSKLATLDATIYTTSLFQLPAGGVGFAVGGQFRRENLEENPDHLNEIGDIIGNSPVPTARGGRKSYAFYAETDIPIFSPTNAIPGFRSLDFTAAGRFEDFRNNGTNVMVPKVGLRWQPIDEQLTLRATWGEGFREPSLEELYAAPISTLFPSFDPKKGNNFEPETNTLVVSNPNLQPEDSRSFSAGFVYSPKYVPGLTYSMDFWDIERTGVIFAKTAQQVLQDELHGTLTPPEAVERDPNSGDLNRIVTVNQNNSAQTARGIDFGLQYQRETPWGTFTSLTQVSYLYEFFFANYSQSFGRVGGVPVYFNGNLAGVTTDPGMSNEGWYRWRGNSSLDWTWRGWDLVWTVHYIDGFKERLGDLTPHWVDHTWIFDAQLSYDFSFLLPPVESTPVPGYSKSSKEVVNGKDGQAKETAAVQTANYAHDFWWYLLHGTRITVGCNNVFGQDPPFASGGGTNAVGYPGFTYDATGRFVYFRLTKKF
jgi:iron complex outermembrane receptor protein